MSALLFALPGNEVLAKKISDSLQAEAGKITLRHFPDGETYVRIQSSVANKDTYVVATLNQPDDKLLPLFFLCKKLKEMGSKKVALVAPYLAYMRQDKQFNPGEAVTSTYFASLLSSFVDELITIDPHLHRRSSLKEIYAVPCLVQHAASKVSEWIKQNIASPVLIGPDRESEQWVSEVANEAKAPYVVLEKLRLGDEKIKLTFPSLEKYRNHTPVLVDDIISTGITMAETVNHLNGIGLKPPVCIGVHGIFAQGAYERLTDAGVSKVVTTNSIPHVTNKIDISALLISSIKAI